MTSGCCNCESSFLFVCCCLHFFFLLCLDVGSCSFGSPALILLVVRECIVCKWSIFFPPLCSRGYMLSTLLSGWVRDSTAHLSVVCIVHCRWLIRTEKKKCLLFLPWPYSNDLMQVLEREHQWKGLLIKVWEPELTSTYVRSGCGGRSF